METEKLDDLSYLQKIFKSLDTNSRHFYSYILDYMNLDLNLDLF